MNCHPDRSEPGNPGERSGETCGSLHLHPTQPGAPFLFIRSNLTCLRQVAGGMNSCHSSLDDRTGAPRSPDFLSRLVALPSCMRFSAKKAAHAVLSRSRVTGNPGSPQRTWDENDGAKPL